MENSEHIVIHKATSRGEANHGWLKSFHTFSFAEYYDPARMNFGALRVLNDDTIEGGTGFGKHPHDNMEIISIPLEGDMEHNDSMGNGSVIKYGDIQVMSAGTGVFHSEKNFNEDKPAKFLQIWVFPDTKGVKPRYDQISLNLADRHNKLQQILSPDSTDEGVWIHQQAWFHIGKFDEGIKSEYKTKKEGNGIYTFIISGNVSIDGQILGSRDGMGISGVNGINIDALSECEILLMEVPMNF